MFSTIAEHRLFNNCVARVRWISNDNQYFPILSTLLNRLSRRFKSSYWFPYKLVAETRTKHSLKGDLFISKHGSKTTNKKRYLSAREVSSSYRQFEILLMGRRTSAEICFLVSESTKDTCNNDFTKKILA